MPEKQTFRFVCLHGLLPSKKIHFEKYTKCALARLHGSKLRTRSKTKEFCSSSSMNRFTIFRVVLSPIFKQRWVKFLHRTSASYDEQNTKNSNRGTERIASPISDF